MQATPRVFRINKGLSITEAAKLLNIKTSELRAIESFEKIPSNRLLKRMEEVYDLDNWYSVIVHDKEEEQKLIQEKLEKEMKRIYQMLDSENSKKILSKKNNKEEFGNLINYNKRRFFNEK